MSPAVSCIMPTADRRRFAPQAIAAFLAQGRDDAELLILDDGGDAIGDLVPDDPRIRYVREDTRRVVGAKRNRLCEMARGEVIVHWDDDDWHASDRLDRQLRALNDTGADVCGLDRVVFLRDDGAAAWDYVYGGRE
ncbi:glycosyl transferase, partial [Caulobacter sp. AP07]|uniref:glycosyltransferase family 2 protein n=1 Tax=Caulobacter sp. AP07 TaxID=1144304 RepID=UPI0002720711